MDFPFSTSLSRNKSFYLFFIFSSFFSLLISFSTIWWLSLKSEEIASSLDFMLTFLDEEKEEKMNRISTICSRLTQILCDEGRLVGCRRRKKNKAKAGHDDATKPSHLSAGIDWRPSHWHWPSYHKVNVAESEVMKQRGGYLTFQKWKKELNIAGLYVWEQRGGKSNIVEKFLSLEPLASSQLLAVAAQDRVRLADGEISWKISIFQHFYTTYPFFIEPEAASFSPEKSTAVNSIYWKTIIIIFMDFTTLPRCLLSECLLNLGRLYPFLRRNSPSPRTVNSCWENQHSKIQY